MESAATASSGWCSLGKGSRRAALYTLFFVSTLRAFVRGRTPVAIAGSLVIVIMLFLMFFYIALPAALVLTMIGIGAVVQSGCLRPSPSSSSI